MKNEKNIIISIHPKYVDKIDSGEKLYEVRTRKLNIEEGTRVWIYRTLPDAQFSSTAIVQSIILINPKKAWKDYSDHLCIDKNDFHNYVGNRSEICLLKLTDVVTLKKPIRLNELRKKLSSFFPPQFFKRLNTAEEIHKILIEELPLSLEVNRL
jgi:predicted transcriptional regulator